MSQTTSTEDHFTIASTTFADLSSPIGATIRRLSAAWAPMGLRLSTLMFERDRDERPLDQQGGPHLPVEAWWEGSWPLDISFGFAPGSAWVVDSEAAEIDMVRGDGVTGSIMMGDHRRSFCEPLGEQEDLLDDFEREVKTIARLAEGFATHWDQVRPSNARLSGDVLAHAIWAGPHFEQDEAHRVAATARRLIKHAVRAPVAVPVPVALAAALITRDWAERLGEALHQPAATSIVAWSEGVEDHLSAFADDTAIGGDPLLALGRCLGVVRDGRPLELPRQSGFNRPLETRTAYGARLDVSTRMSRDELTEREPLARLAYLATMISQTLSFYQEHPMSRLPFDVGAEYAALRFIAQELASPWLSTIPIPSLARMSQWSCQQLGDYQTVGSLPECFDDHARSRAAFVLLDALLWRLDHGPWRQV